MAVYAEIWESGGVRDFVLIYSFLKIQYEDEG